MNLPINITLLHARLSARLVSMSVLSKSKKMAEMGAEVAVPWEALRAHMADIVVSLQPGHSQPYGIGLAVRSVFVFHAVFFLAYLLRHRYWPRLVVGTTRRPARVCAADCLACGQRGVLMTRWPTPWA